MTNDEKIFRTAAIEAQVWSAAYAAWLRSMIEICDTRFEAHEVAVERADEATLAFLSGVELMSVIEQQKAATRGTDQ